MKKVLTTCLSILLCFFWSFNAFSTEPPNPNAPETFTKYEDFYKRLSEDERGFASGLKLIIPDFRDLSYLNITWFPTSGYEIRLTKNLEPNLSYCFQFYGEKGFFYFLDDQINRYKNDEVFIEQYHSPAVKSETIRENEPATVYTWGVGPDSTDYIFWEYKNSTTQYYIKETTLSDNQRKQSKNGYCQKSTICVWNENYQYLLWHYGPRAITKEIIECPIVEYEPGSFLYQVKENNLNRNIFTQSERIFYGIALSLAFLSIGCLIIVLIIFIKRRNESFDSE